MTPAVLPEVAQLEGVTPLDTVLPATIEFWTEIVPPSEASSPPPATPPSFWAIVEFVIVAVLPAPWLTIPPPIEPVPVAALDAIVDCSTTSEPCVPVTGLGPKLWIPPASPGHTVVHTVPDGLVLASMSECV